MKLQWNRHILLWPLKLLGLGRPPNLRWAECLPPPPLNGSICWPANHPTHHPKKNLFIFVMSLSRFKKIRQNFISKCEDKPCHYKPAYSFKPYFKTSAKCQYWNSVKPVTYIRPPNRRSKGNRFQGSNFRNKKCQIHFLVNHVHT